MKPQTVYELIKEHHDETRKNVTPIFKFKIGDMVKPSPIKPSSELKIPSGKVVGIDGHLVTVELEPGSYNTESVNELWLMPAINKRSEINGN